VAATGLEEKGRCNVRKKLTVLALVGLAFVLLVGPVLAAGSSRETRLDVKLGPRRQAHVISMTGTIKPVDKDEKRPTSPSR
jgi:hypothetical protein